MKVMQRCWLNNPKIKIKQRQILKIKGLTPKRKFKETICFVIKRSMPKIE